MPELSEYFQTSNNLVIHCNIQSNLPALSANNGKSKSNPNNEVHRTGNRSRTEKLEKPTFRFGSVRFAVFGAKMPTSSDNTYGDVWVLGIRHPNFLEIFSIIAWYP
jgi:hypothetical protein